MIVSGYGPERGQVIMLARSFFMVTVIAIASLLQANAKDSGGTTSMIAKRLPEQCEELRRNAVSSLVPANRSISGCVTLYRPEVSCQR